MIKDKKTGKILSGRHKLYECKKSNWDLYFRKVFGQSSQHQNVKKEDKSKPSAADSDEPEFVIPDDG
mgnify:CR=1 FL=1